MKRLVIISMLACVSPFFWTSSASADHPKNPVPVIGTGTGQSLDAIGEIPVLASTTWLARFEFESGPNCTAMGWTSVDLSAQTGDWFHVDDFAGLGGGNSGLLVALEGAQSMWCGARPGTSNPALCSYASLPGYGDNWNQALCTAGCLSVTGGVQISLSAFWNSEPGYDATQLSVDNCDDNWIEIYGNVGVWDGLGTDTLTIDVADTLHSESLRFRFLFASNGSWSDQDGLYDSDGAFVLDEISVNDSTSTILPLENFEDETVGAIDADDWESCTPPGYGDFAGLYNAFDIVQEDPCRFNFYCAWSFYTGSTYNYACGGYPDQKVVPYENARGQYIWNEIWSPDILVSGTGHEWNLEFDVYRDLQLNALVFYEWRVRSEVSGCPGDWRERGLYYYGGGCDWYRSRHEIGDLIESGASSVQVAIGVVDACDIWAGLLGSCNCHSHAPLIDNVALYRVDRIGPSWNVRHVDMFQDNFPEDCTITGTARADAALDIRPRSDSWVQPGDSVVVSVGGAGYLVPGDPNSGPAVFCYVSVDGPHGGVTGSDLIDDPRYYMVGTVAAGGRSWTQIQMDFCRTSTGAVVPLRYNVDLNDSFFVPGDTVYFFFGASDSYLQTSYFSVMVPTHSGVTDDIHIAAQYADEFTILPAGGYQRGGDILYVDGSDGYGAQPFFDTAFEMLGIKHLVDRFDIRSPSSAAGNHPGTRVANASCQLIPAYRKILWNTGRFSASFGDGSGRPDKSDDTGLLYAFLAYHDSSPGLYLSGDDLADTWLNQHTSASSNQLRTTFCNFSLDNDDHVDEDLGHSPFLIGEYTGIFRNSYGIPDSMVAHGGCPDTRDFDVISESGSSELQMQYFRLHPSTFEVYANGGAVVSQSTTTMYDQDARVVLSGFSFDAIRDNDAPPNQYEAPDRADHLRKILNWMNNFVDAPTGTQKQPTVKTSLGQNHPNPFNPTTTIEFTLRETSRVRLDVYNVAGQLVRTLVDGRLEGQKRHVAKWNGRNNDGQDVSSGVYFYRLVTVDGAHTRKMVLLK